MRTFAVKQLFSNLNIAKILIKSYITCKIILYLGFLIISFTYIDKSTNNINLIIDAWALTSFLIFFPIHSLPYKNQECLVWKGENCWNNLWYYRPWRRKKAIILDIIFILRSLYWLFQQHFHEKWINFTWFWRLF